MICNLVVNYHKFFDQSYVLFNENKTLKLLFMFNIFLSILFLEHHAQTTSLATVRQS